MKLVQVGGFALCVALGCGGSGEEETLRDAAEAARRDEERALEALRAAEPPAAEPVLAAAPPVAEPVPEPAAAPVTAATWEGDITRSAAGLVVLDGASIGPAEGAKGTLSKKIDQKFGGMSISAWLVIADVIVDQNAGTTVVVKIVEEQSVTEINGKKVDHFAPGGHVKLEVGP